MNAQPKNSIRVSEPVADHSQALRQSFEELGLPEHIECYERIGRGGMGAVYRARHKITGAELAVKVLLPGHAGDDVAVSRFLQEARILAKLSDPHIVKVHDCNVNVDGIPYLIMDFVDGYSLEQRLESGTLSVEEAVELATQCAAALDTAHKAGIVHRDLKPSNIVVGKGTDEQMKVTVLDFGISKYFKPDPSSVKLTATGDVMGTPLYMSPENCMGYQLDGRSDIYSLGCVLYHALCGFPPFDTVDAMRVLAQHVRERASTDKLVERGVPPEMVRIINRMMEKKPDDRYPSMKELIDDLKQFRQTGHARAHLTGGQKAQLHMTAGAIFWATAGFAVAYGIVFALTHLH